MTRDRPGTLRRDDSEVDLAAGSESGGAGASSDLLERDGELAQIDRVVRQASSGIGSLVVVEAPAGAGKTRLLGATAAAGRASGMLVLEASGSEFERELGFGIVRALFEGCLARATASRRRSVLSGAAALAAPVVLGPSLGKASEPPEPASVLHGLFWIVSNLAEQEPLMLVVDDVHWADQPSLEFLAYLARRRAGLALLLTVAMRPHEPAAHQDLVSALSTDPAADRLTPAPLSEAAVGRLVDRSLGTGAAPEFVAACHAATVGNPFLVGELMAALSADQVAPSRDNAGRVEQIGPRTVSRAVLARVSRLGSEAGALTEAVAVLGGRAELRHAGPLAGLGADAAARASDALVQIGVLRGIRPLHFVHPLVQAAIYETIPPGRRSMLHTAAAQLLAAEHAAPARIGLHLLNAEPAGQRWVVEALLQSAAEASATGAPEQAAGYLRRAFAEPPPPDERAAVLHQLGAAELLARDRVATDHLAQALEATHDPAIRGETALLLGRAAVSTGRLAEARQLLGPVIDELEATQPAIVARLEAYRWAAGVWDPRFTTQLERELPRLRALADRAGATGRSLLLMIAFRSTFEGRHHDEILALVDRGLDDGRFIHSESAEAIEISWAARALTFIDELDRAECLLDELVADSRKHGSVMGYATACAWRAAVALRRGLIAPAEADARSAVELANAHGLSVIAPHAYSFLGEALLEQGELDDADSLLNDADLGPMRGSRPEGRFLHTRARVRLARGDRQGAIADLRACEEQEPWFRNPNALAWRSTLALALPEASRADALQLVDLELNEARRVGQPRAIGVGLRAKGLLSTGEAQISLLEQAVDVLALCPSRLEQAQSWVDLGTALRRANRRNAARQPLARALDLASACGASALARRARDELVTAGARPRRERLTGVESLTASEQRVSQMAAAGMSNRDIAQALFVTVKAVALHLTHTYQKLGITGRAQLAEALGDADRRTPDS